MTLVVNTNSYVDAADADTYFVTRIDSATWDAAATSLKEEALVTATQIIDNHPWIGAAVSSSQALAWPRKNVVYFDDRMGQSITVGNTVTPNAVKIAVYEQALHLLNNEDLLAQTTQTFEAISIGSISLTDTNNDVTRTSIKPDIVMRPLRPFIRKGVSGMGQSWWRSN